MVKMIRPKDTKVSEGAKDRPYQYSVGQVVRLRFNKAVMVMILARLDYVQVEFVGKHFCLTGPAYACRVRLPDGTVILDKVCNFTETELIS